MKAIANMHGGPGGEAASLRPPRPAPAETRPDPDEPDRAPALGRGAIPLTFGPLARQSLISLVVKLLALAMGFLFAVLAARLLGASGYGELAVAMSAAGIASVVAGLGINGLAVREVARLKAIGDLSRLRAFRRWSLIVTGLTAALAAAVLGLVSRHGGPFADELLVAAPIAILLTFLQLARGLEQGAGNVVAAQLPLDVIRWVLIVGALGALLLTGHSIAPAIVLWLVLLALVGALLATCIFAGLRFDAGSSDGPASRREPWLGAAAPFLGIALFGIAGAEVNTILLGWLSGPEQAGLFQPLAKIAPIMILAVEAIAMPLSPRVAALWHSGQTELLKSTIRKAAFAASVATVAIVGSVLLLAPAILGAFGSEFTANGHYLIWIGAAQLVNALLGPAPLLISMAGRMGHRIAVQSVTFLVQAGIGVLAIPTYGAGGAAFALAAGILVWSLLHWAVARFSLGIDTSVFGRPAAPNQSGEAS